MRLTIKVKKKGKKLDRIKKSLRSVHNERSDSGYFTEQGLHHSGHTFPVLMAIHEFGFGVTPRPVFTIASLQMKRKGVTKFIDVLGKNWGSKLSKTNPINNSLFLDGLGIGVNNIIRPIFGNPSILSVTSNPTPLIETSELVARLSRKNTLDKVLR